MDKQRNEETATDTAAVSNNVELCSPKELIIEYLPEAFQNLQKSIDDTSEAKPYLKKE